VALSAGTGGVALAGEEVIEINHDRALVGQITPGDGAGYPVVITKSGSYRLTSALSVPSGSHGITISAADVTVDLNGFAVESSYVCCGAGGAGIGIRSSSVRTTLRNGRVLGFPEAGISLGAFSHVEAVPGQVGGNGIELGSASLALANRVTGVGQSGLAFTGTAPGIYRAHPRTRPWVAHARTSQG
jgi:hypothetical protein